MQLAWRRLRLLCYAIQRTITITTKYIWFPFFFLLLFIYSNHRRAYIIISPPPAGQRSSLSCRSRALLSFVAFSSCGSVWPFGVWLMGSNRRPFAVFLYVLDLTDGLDYPDLAPFYLAQFQNSDSRRLWAFLYMLGCVAIVPLYNPPLYVSIFWVGDRVNCHSL